MDQLDVNGLSEEEFLSAYDIRAFQQPSLTVDILLMTISENKAETYRKLPDKSLKILLIKRKEHPFISKWALPGGFVKINESIENAAYRELMEETNVSHVYLEQLRTYGALDRDPRGRIISTSYMSLVNVDEIKVKAGTDAEDARWFDIDYNIYKCEQKKTDSGFIEDKMIKITFTNNDIRICSEVKVSKIVNGRHISYQSSIVDRGQLSFDHALIIENGISSLRHKLKQSDIIFHMMPDLFTLTELQKAYEVINDEKLIKANFRRKISRMVSETPNFTSHAGHRPSKLYRFNPLWEA